MLTYVETFYLCQLVKSPVVFKICPFDYVRYFEIFAIFPIPSFAAMHEPKHVIGVEHD
jgi:hypothetical protein